MPSLQDVCLVQISAILALQWLQQVKDSRINVSPAYIVTQGFQRNSRAHTLVKAQWWYPSQMLTRKRKSMWRAKMDILHGKYAWQYQHEQMSSYPTQAQHFLHHLWNLLLTWSRSFASLCSSAHWRRTVRWDKVSSLQNAKPAIRPTNSGIRWAQLNHTISINMIQHAVLPPVSSLNTSHERYSCFYITSKTIYASYEQVALM